MFIEIRNYMINTNYIAYVYFYEADYSYRPSAMIMLKDDRRIDLDDRDEIEALKEALRSEGVALVAVEAPDEEYE